MAFKGIEIRSVSPAPERECLLCGEKTRSLDQVCGACDPSFRMPEVDPNRVHIELRYVASSYRGERTPNR